ncbi:MAG: hypothetical protein V4585_19775 [Bacteroidota bacterium]
MENSLLRGIAVARVVGGKHTTTAGRMRNTNKGKNNSLIRGIAVARVVGGKHTTTAGRMRNTNKGKNIYKQN